jgi:hypothetical protein
MIVFVETGRLMQLQELMNLRNESNFIEARVSITHLSPTSHLSPDTPIALYVHHRSFPLSFTDTIISPPPTPP